MNRISSLTLLSLILIIAGCSEDSADNRVRVMTINVRYDNPNDGVNAWPKRAAQVAGFIQSEVPDLLGMQEVLLRQYNYLDSALLDYTSVGVGRSDGLQGGEMNPVFFRTERFEMVRTKTFWLSDTPEVAGSMGWGASLPRIVTWMELIDKKNQEHLFFFNTHFAHDSDSARVMSSGILLNEVGKIAGSLPFVITGDFNMTPDSRGYAIITETASSAPLIRDSRVISEAKPYGPIYTFNGFTDNPAQGRIDYIFVSSGTAVVEHNTFFRKDKGIFISDHWPVGATVILQHN